MRATQPGPEPVSVLRRPLILALFALAFLGAALAPLATYMVSLACFGLAHVVVELRFVDRRYGPRLSESLRGWFLLVLLGIFLLRGTLALGIYRGPPPHLVELSLVVALVAGAIPFARDSGRSVTTLGIAAGLLALGAAFAPLYTLCFFAVAHNLTPLGFIADIERELPRRAPTLSAAALLCLLPALLLGLGIPLAAASRLGLDWAQLSPFPESGGLHSHLGAFFPPSWRRFTFITGAFAACAYLQCTHYLLVMLALPRLQAQTDSDSRETRQSELLPWPKTGRTLTKLLLAGSAVLLLHFAIDFKQARSLYGMLAAVHAWWEIPLLLLALVPLSSPLRRVNRDAA